MRGASADASAAKENKKGIADRLSRTHPLSGCVGEAAASLYLCAERKKCALFALLGDYNIKTSLLLSRMPCGTRSACPLQQKTAMFYNHITRSGALRSKKATFLTYMLPTVLFLGHFFNLFLNLCPKGIPTASRCAACSGEAERLRQKNKGGEKTTAARALIGQNVFVLLRAIIEKMARFARNCGSNSAKHRFCPHQEWRNPEQRCFNGTKQKNKTSSRCDPIPRAKASRCAACAASGCASSRELHGGARRSLEAERASERSERVKKGHARIFPFFKCSFSLIFAFSSSDRPKKLYFQ